LTYKQLLVSKLNFHCSTTMKTESLICCLKTRLQEKDQDLKTESCVVVSSLNNSKPG